MTRARTLCFTRARDLAHVLDLERHLTFARALTRARDLARDLALDLDRDLALDPDHVVARALDCALALALDRALDRALTLDPARARARALDLDRDFALGRAPRLATAVQASRGRMAELVATLDAAAAPASGAAQEDGVRPVRAAAGVVQRMVRVLPAIDRARYREEYLAELHDLAENQAPRRVQLRFVLRAATTMWSLRQALRAPHSGRERAR